MFPLIIGQTEILCPTSLTTSNGSSVASHNLTQQCYKSPLVTVLSPTYTPKIARSRGMIYICI